MRQRGQVALAFRPIGGLTNSFVTSSSMSRRISGRGVVGKSERALAAKIVRDQWGIWARVVAVAETLPAGEPPLFYVIEYKDQKVGAVI